MCDVVLSYRAQFQLADLGTTLPRSKYMYAAEYAKIGTWGASSEQHNRSFWAVLPNLEGFNDGLATALDLSLVCHYGPIPVGEQVQ